MYLPRGGVSFAGARRWRCFLTPHCLVVVSEQGARADSRVRVQVPDAESSPRSGLRRGGWVAGRRAAIRKLRLTPAMRNLRNAPRLRNNSTTHHSGDVLAVSPGRAQKPPWQRGRKLRKYRESVRSGKRGFRRILRERRAPHRAKFFRICREFRRHFRPEIHRISRALRGRMAANRKPGLRKHRNFRSHSVRRFRCSAERNYFFAGPMRVSPPR